MKVSTENTGKGLDLSTCKYAASSHLGKALAEIVSHEYEWDIGDFNAMQSLFIGKALSSAGVLMANANTSACYIQPHITHICSRPGTISRCK